MGVNSCVGTSMSLRNSLMEVTETIRWAVVVQPVREDVVTVAGSFTMLSHHGFGIKTNQCVAPEIWCGLVANVAPKDPGASKISGSSTLGGRANK
uniref:Uncharacterized protein n=1 Tax=Romanomermis culicivorax TaxID=13658 RepID=A0A915IR50_ROMCU